MDRDFCFLLNAFDVEPGSRTPMVNTMTDFNIWCWNSRVFPDIDTLNVRLNDRVRIRVGNLTMTNHPIHLHGHEFEVTGTDGGPTPPGSRWPEVTTDVAVGQMRQIELLADEEGDWAMHCHKSHHTMNAMGHDVPNMIGVDHRGIVGKINSVAPDYMVMGERGMADMGDDGNADPRQHRAHDDRHRPIRPAGDGRHVQRVQGAQRPEAGRLQRPGCLRAPARHLGLRIQRPIWPSRRVSSQK